ncbi:replication/maintenance protein RepL [Streptomyces sp. NPDC058279]|uniref:replication/maintenance protein RepL n=1 Tax=Streptomyces sp. NPDC058279 TaxID=3346418 RepID=UPI0036E3F3A5
MAIVLLALIGFQEVGGHITKTQEEIGKQVGYSRAHVAWAQTLLMEDGVLRRVRKGVYQLVPSAVLRGGVRTPEQGKRKVPGKPERVHQLDLLKEILEDPNAPEAFKAMAQVDAQLPAGPRQTKRKGTE